MFRSLLASINRSVATSWPAGVPSARTTNCCRSEVCERCHPLLMSHVVHAPCLTSCFHCLLAVCCTLGGEANFFTVTGAPSKFWLIFASIFLAVYHHPKRNRLSRCQCQMCDRCSETSVSCLIQQHASDSSNNTLAIATTTILSTPTSHRFCTEREFIMVRRDHFD